MRTIPEENSTQNENIKPFNIKNFVSGGFLSNYAKMQKIQLYDPNKYEDYSEYKWLYSREEVFRFLRHPHKHWRDIICVSIHLYETNILYRRLCNYLSDMLLFSYTVSPLNFNGFEHTPEVLEKYRKFYYKAMNQLEKMNIKQNANSIMRAVVREGVYYGVKIESNNSYYLHRFPHHYCKITSWQDGIPLYSLNLQYFYNKKTLITSLGGELEEAYNAYVAGKIPLWYEVSSKISQCVLADESLGYPLPLLCGLIPDLYLMEDYKDLAKNKKEIDIYKLLTLKLPLKDGKPSIDGGIAEDYYRQVADQLPPLIGLALTPFDTDEVDFENAQSNDDITSKASRDLFTTTGISGLLFNDDNASSATVMYGILKDMSLVIPIMRGIEKLVNKELKALNTSFKFKITFQEVSIYNKGTYADELRKDMQYGLPVKSALSAVSGVPISEMMSTAFLENDILDLQKNFIPPLSTSTINSDDVGKLKSIGELSEAGEKSRESKGGSV